MKLSDRVHLVGSGRNGFGMTDPFDCHVYLVDGGDELALIDCGAGLGIEQILGNVRSAGFDPRQIRQLLLTHAHGDHAGGAARLRASLDVRVVASAEAASWIRAGDEDAISLGVAKQAGIYPSDYRFEACPVDLEVVEGDQVRVGNLELRVHDSPGHARGHCSFTCRDGDRAVLFAGDAIFYGGRVVLQTTWDCSIQESAATIRKLAALKVETLLAGHAALALGEAQRHFDLALARLDHLLPPLQLET